MDYPDSTSMQLGRRLRPQREALDSGAAEEYVKLKKDKLLTQLRLALVTIGEEWMQTGGRITDLRTQCSHILDRVVAGRSATRRYTEDSDSQLLMGVEDRDLGHGLGNNNEEIEPPRDGAVSRLGQRDEDDELYFQQPPKSKTRPLSPIPGNLRSRVTSFADSFRTSDRNSSATAAPSRRQNSPPSFGSLSRSNSQASFPDFPSLRHADSVLSRSYSHNSFQDFPSLRRTDSDPSINGHSESRPGPPISRVPRSLSNAAITLAAVPLAPVPEFPSPDSSPARLLRPITSTDSEEPDDEEVEKKKKKGSLFKRMVKKIKRVMRK